MRVSGQAQQAFAETARRAREGDQAYRWALIALQRAGFAAVAQTAGDVLLATAAQVGVVFGVTERTVRRWIRDGLPVHRAAHGNQAALYDVAAVLRWRDQQAAAKAEAQEEHVGDKDFWLSQLRQEQAIKARDQNRVRRGELIEAAALESAWSEAGRVLRERLEPLVAAYGAGLQSQIVEALDEVERAVDASLIRTQAHEDEPDDSKPEPKPERKPRAKRKRKKRKAGAGKRKAKSKSRAGSAGD